MPDRSNVDIVENFQKAYRSAAGAPQQGYLCICEERYTVGAKLWSHAKQAHSRHLGITNLEDEAGAKRLFLDQAYVPKVIIQVALNLTPT